jgi:hypothetical protein
LTLPEETHNLAATALETKTNPTATLATSDLPDSSTPLTDNLQLSRQISWPLLFDSDLNTRTLLQQFNSKQSVPQDVVVQREGYGFDNAKTAQLEKKLFQVSANSLSAPVNVAHFI